MTTGYPLILTDVKIEISGTDLSCFCEEAHLTPETSMVAVPTFCGVVDYPGATKWHLTAKFAQSFDAGAVDATLQAAVEAWQASQTPCSYLVIPHGAAAISATNPSFSGHCIPVPFPPIGGAVGALSEIDIDWICTGEPARAAALASA